jgi:hypothetical protein
MLVQFFLHQWPLKLTPCCGSVAAATWYSADLQYQPHNNSSPFPPPCLLQIITEYLISLLPSSPHPAVTLVIAADASAPAACALTLSDPT